MKRLTADQAQAAALRLLGALAQNPEDLGGFLALSGMGPGELRAHAGDATFLAGLLDHILADEGLLVRLCTTIDMPFELPGQARAALPGHDWDRGSA